MPSTYVVEDARHKAPKPDKGYGPMQIIALALKDDSGEITQAEWYTKAATPVPTVGVQLTGDLIPNQFGGMNFKRAQQFPSGSGAGPRPEDPKRAKRILRQHSQDMALQIVRLARDMGLIAEPGPQNGADLLAYVSQLADWFDKDAEAAGERA